ncbi:MAG: NAD-dependent epimerase/dehydratase family protein, partial [Gemmatimonadetes bacterium]|nr:NAD-dependent epimerase/dehydratase family protein [Gemmatimonadota bacterium]
MRAGRVLVTGGAGFIGSHVAQGYLARGHEVWVVDDLSRGRAENVPSGARLIRLDIGDPGVDDLFREAGGFEVVNHHAAQVDVRQSVADPREDARVNVDGLLNVLECAKRHHARRFLFVSSGGVVYGEAEARPTPETAPKRPLSPYGVSKLCGEYYVHYYHVVHGLDTVALRYSNVYGPRQDPHGEAGVVAIFCSRLRTDQALRVYGDGDQTRDYVYVGDVVDANLLLTKAALAPAAHPDDRCFNVGAGAETSVNQLARLLMDVA